MNLIFGSAGFSKELDFLLRHNDPSFKADYFVGLDSIGELLNGTKVISEDEAFKIVEKNNNTNIYIGIGSGVIRKKIIDKLHGLGIQFPNAVHKSVIYDSHPEAIKIGTGNIICAGVILTTNITMGDQNHFNLNTTVGHDTAIGNYNTMSPGVHVSGNVRIGDRTFIGTGAVVLERVTICSDVVIGAGAVVVKDIVEPGTYVGLPVKRIK